MKRPCYAARLAWVLLAVAFATGCSAASPNPTPPGMAASRSSVSETPLFVASPTAAEPSVPSAPPSSPTSYAGEVHPGEYHVVVKDELKGIVDGGGTEVLPIRYQAASVVFATGDNAAFFADGRIYLLNGSTLTDGWYLSAYGFMDRYIVASVPDAEFGHRYGVMTREGELIAPFQYEEICEIDGGFLGAKGTFQKLPRDVDIYDGDGKLLRSESIHYKGVRSGYMEVVDKTGKKWGLLDSSFHTVVEPEWNSVWTIGDGWFAVVSTDHLWGVINSKGKSILPVKYAEIDAQAGGKDTGEAYYTALSARRTYSYLYDGKGKQLLKSDRYFFLSHRNGLLVRRDRKAPHSSGDAAQIVDMESGKVLACANRIVWDDDFYRCRDGNSKEFVCNGDGTRIPLPGADSITPISADRFILSNELPAGATETGLYDAAGNALVPMGKHDIYTLSVGHMLVYRDGDLLGLMDYDGKIVLPAGYQVLESNPGKSLLSAQDGSVHGLIDLEGNWVWSAPGPFPPPPANDEAVRQQSDE